MTSILIDVAQKELRLRLDPAVLADKLNLSVEKMSSDLGDFLVPICLRRRGVEAKLVVGTPEPDPDPVLLRTLADAHRWATALRDGTPISDVARDAGHDDVFIRTRGPLAFLAPKIQIAIRYGTLSHELTLRRILRHQIPLDWTEQDRLYRI